MIYKGSRLQQLVNKSRGYHAELSQKLAARTNAKSYNLALLYKDGRNVTLSTLTDLLQATGLPVDYFVDFEPSEFPAHKCTNDICGSNVISNSAIPLDVAQKIEHLNEVIALKDQIIQDKVDLIEELKLWKHKYYELLNHTESSK